jgi:hypothetical protein
MELAQRISELLLEAAEEKAMYEGAVDFDGEDVDVLSPFYMSRPGTIYGGSNEIQRNIVAKEVLRLPGKCIRMQHPLIAGEFGACASRHARCGPCGFAGLRRRPHRSGDPCEGWRGYCSSGGSCRYRTRRLRPEPRA